MVSCFYLLSLLIGIEETCWLSDGINKGIGLYRSLLLLLFFQAFFRHLLLCVPYGFIYRCAQGKRANDLLRGDGTIPGYSHEQIFCQPLAEKLPGRVRAIPFPSNNYALNPATLQNGSYLLCRSQVKLARRIHEG